MNVKWLMAGVLAFGMAASTAPAAERGRAARDQDEQVKFRDVPEVVQKAIENERGKNDIVTLWHVVRDGKEFYRAVIDTRGEDTSIRVSPAGKVLSAQEVNDPPRNARTAAAGGGAKRQMQLGTDDKNGEVVDFDRLPGNVKTQIGRLAKSGKVEEVVKYQRRGNTWYRAEVGSGRNMYYIRVPETVNSDTRAFASRELDPGEVIAFDRTPGAVKGKIGSLAKSGKVDEVVEYDRGGRKYYEALIDSKQGGDYVVIVDDRGNEVDSIPRAGRRD